jgi:uncharacterized membrane protein YraQ (UPF0718 family)/YHS domain-containing protein
VNGSLLALSAGGAATDVGHSLREAFYMFWDTLWALALGFGLSGAVQAFVSREAMQRRLGDHRVGSLARSTAYGMASSSCSYAASAMAKSLFAKGADFLTAMVFMFASTNLVIELGIVLAVLIGWQFVVAEFVGGFVMIALLVLAGGLWLTGRAVARARAVATSRETPDDEVAHDHTTTTNARARIRSAAGWSDAAGFTISDLKMLRREMLVGFVVAGFLTVLVPAHVWSDVFAHGHGFWTSLENVTVGPFVAIISFVCSIGNIPLAAALWNGGISFGGVVSFVFADLITLPLLLIYRKQYGIRMTVRMLAVFWAVMSAAGLATEYLFRAAGISNPARHAVVVGDTLRWNYTTILDIVALVAMAGLYWLYLNRERLGGGAGYATDPVCGMQVETAHAPAASVHGGVTVYFCSEHCREHYAKAAASS